MGYFIAYKNLYSTWLKSSNDFDVGDVRNALNLLTLLISKNDKALLKESLTLYKRACPTLAIALLPRPKPSASCINSSKTF